tara:strand:+ start:21188 stop:22468 length:1281 start_codon:yes stop_codon:yes gene_type:complete
MTTESATWNGYQKIGFRFIFLYFALHISTFFISFLPYSTSLVTGIRYNIQSLPVWVAKTFFDIIITVFPNGSGDTTYNYFEVLVFFILAIIGTIIWSLIDRKRTNYDWLLRFFRVYVSYYVAGYMLSYGFSKVFYLQFSEPSFLQLFRTYGESSPMGIAWTFMGASKTYTMFSGFAEVIGGLLLFYRRTRTIGALVVFAVMFNVFMMNMSYDIPVKLFSFHLMIKALFIASLDYKRILNLFVFRKPLAISNELKPLFQNRNWRIAGRVLKFVFIGYAIYIYMNSSLEYSKQRYEGPKPFFYGVYNTESYIKNNDSIPPLLTDKTRWKRLIMDRGYLDKYMIIRGMNEQSRWYTYEIDSVKSTVKMTSTRDSLDVLNLAFTKNDSILTFKGTWKNDSIQVKLNKYDTSKILLTNRGFNWINEYPYNR